RRKTQIKTPSECHPDRPTLARRLCAQCYQKGQRERNPGRRQKYYANAKAKYPGKYRRDNYGLRPEQIAQMLQEQGDSCAICGSSEPGTIGWCVDHDHATRGVRALLCATCNSGLGFFSDDMHKLRSATDYVTNWRVKHQSRELQG